MNLTRRSLGLGALGTAFAALTTGATPAQQRRRFVFVHAMGGWDPLCVFAPMFAASAIEMEPEAQAATVGDFTLVDHPSRPLTVPFFQAWGDRTLLINGINTRSVNHETCQTVSLTGQTSDSAIDWPTALAVADTSAYYMPHLVFGGPAFPGEETVYVTRAEGFVQQAVSGELLAYGDGATTVPSTSERSRLDTYLEARAAAFDAKHGLPITRDQHLASQRGHDLVAADVIAFPPGDTMQALATGAVRALADEVTRCATLSSGFLWDTHPDNGVQSGLFEGLFADLDYMLKLLSTTAAPEGGMLSQSTTVVVMSEMARTPAFNATQGRDHWPYTSAMIIGPGVTGGRTIGGYTDLYAGIGVDPKSGEPDPSRKGIDAKILGATLLALGGVDPAEYISKPEVIEGVLA